MNVLGPIQGAGPSVSHNTAMRVGIDATSVFDEGTGVENHVLTVVDALCRFTDHEVVAFVRRAPPRRWKSFGDRIEVRSLPADSQVIATQILLPRAAAAAHLDVLYCGGKPPPATGSGPLLVGIHDAIPWEHPEFMGSRRAAVWFRSLYRRAARRGATIATVSEFSRHAVAARLHLDPPSVHVIGNALAPWFQNLAAGPPGDRPPCAPPGEYVLAVARADPRRGIGTLLEAWDDLRRLRPGTSLVLAGKAGWKVNTLFERAGRTPGVVLTGEVANRELAGLYTHARAFVTASVYEGFGLPLLEAMSFGLPTVASAIPPHLEVAGGIAQFFAPGSSEQLAGTLIRVLTDDELRASVGPLGRERAAVYSAERLATLLTDAAETARSA